MKRKRFAWDIDIHLCDDALECIMSASWGSSLYDHDLAKSEGDLESGKKFTRFKV